MSTNRRPLLGVADLSVGLLVVIGVWIALPTRWWLVDVVGSLIAVALFVSGVGLVTGAPWARRVGMAVGGTVAGVGAATVTALAVSAGYLAGLYGPVGQGGALILGFVLLLVLPYLVIFPALQVYVLARRASAADLDA